MGAGKKAAADIHTFLCEPDPAAAAWR